MAENPQSLRECFNSGETKRKQLDLSWETNSESYQANVRAAIGVYEECRKIAGQVALFSSNETLEDISSRDLQYLLIDFYLADLLLRQNAPNRKGTLLQARQAYERFLDQLDSYEILSKEDTKLHERYSDKPDNFSTASTADAAVRRETKIARFKEEKALKGKLEYLAQNPSVLHNDEDTFRNLYLTQIKLCTHQTFQSLESIAQELQILALAPPMPSTQADAPRDDRRERERNRDGYTARLDRPLSELLAGGKAGPILSKDGKPLKPFTLLDSRQRLQQGVFRPGHNLPTMTIDEYLEEEKRRGGIIEGGGPQSELQPEPDEDNLEKADEETMKAREWDEFVEANPKGSGNTINRG